MKKIIKLFYLHSSCKKAVEDSNKNNLKVIKNTLLNRKILKVSKNNHNTWKALQLTCT